MMEKKRIFARSCHPRLGLFEQFAKDEVRDYLVPHPGKGVSRQVIDQW
mgnify:CR=1 FL=1